MALTIDREERPLPAEIIESPCIKICAVDGARKMCIGCGRTLAEIGGWTRFSPEQRRQVMDQAAARLRNLPAAAGNAG